VRALPASKRTEIACWGCRLTPESKAKKACDQQLPACGRCVRLNKACGGYRDLNALIFKNETASFVRRASSQSESAATSSTASTRQPSPPDRESLARSFFFREFVIPMRMSFLEETKLDAFLLAPVLACAYEVLSNRDGDVRSRELSRQFYVQAIHATQKALRDANRVMEDRTLTAVCLLAIYEVGDSSRERKPR
jgi:hypothetical protein